jgi:hypothetical protein
MFQQTDCACLLTLCRQDGSNIGNGSVSNAQPYSHITYNYQDTRMNSPQYNATLAHYAYTYDTYTGNSSYLQMQLWQNYKRTAGQDKVSLPFMMKAP